MHVYVVQLQKEISTYYYDKKKKGENVLSANWITQRFA